MMPVGLAAERIDEAGAVLARAFQQEAGTIYFFPDEEERARFMPAFFRAIVARGLQHGEVFVVGEPMRGVAIWQAMHSVAPAAGDGHHGDDLQDEVRTWPEGARERLRTLVGHANALHARLMGAPHMYLLFLGVEPAHQGRGLGGMLIAAMPAGSSGDRMPCYLDTLEARNVLFYARHGFRVLEECVVPGSDVHVWAMRRD